MRAIDLIFRAKYTRYYAYIYVNRVIVDLIVLVRTSTRFITESRVLSSNEIQSSAIPITMEQKTRTAEKDREFQERRDGKIRKTSGSLARTARKKNHPGAIGFSRARVL